MFTSVSSFFKKKFLGGRKIEQKEIMKIRAETNEISMQETKIYQMNPKDNSFKNQYNQ